MSLLCPWAWHLTSVCSGRLSLKKMEICELFSIKELIKVFFIPAVLSGKVQAKDKEQQNNKTNVCACWWIFHVFVWRWLAEALTGVEDLDCSLALGKGPPTAPLMEDDSVERTRRQNRNYPDLLNSPLTFLWLLTELAQEYKRIGKWRRDEGEWRDKKR